MFDPINPEHSTIEGVPLKDVIIDAICGAGISPKVAEWAAAQGLVDIGDRWTEDYWNRDKLKALDLYALFAIYGRQKRL